VARLAEGGRVMLPVQYCLRAMQGGREDRGVLYLALSCCLKVECKAARTAVYAALRRLLVGAPAEELMEFKFHHRLVFRKRPFGQGAGLRRLVRSWYLETRAGEAYTERPAFDLAYEVVRVRSRHRWTHGDLVKLARVTCPKDPAKEAVLAAAVRSLAKARELLGGQEEARPILEYLASVEQYKRSREAGELVRLVEQHSADLDVLPSEALAHQEVWEAAIPMTPLRRVLHHLKQMHRRGFLATRDSRVLARLLNHLAQPGKVAASGLQVGEVLAVHTKVAAGWPPLPGQTKPEVLPAPHPSLVLALDSLLQAALANTPPAEGAVLAAVDARPTLASNHCWGAPGLACSRAAAVTLLALQAGGATVTLVTCNKRGVQEVPLGPGDTVSEVQRRLEGVQGARAVRPAEVLDWARARGAAHRLVLVLSDSHTSLADREGWWAALAAHRLVVPAAKAVWAVLGSRALDQPVARPGDRGMLDITGWEPALVRLLQAFLSDGF